jgi:hypothetical protein
MVFCSLLQRSILIDCEDRIKSLLAALFENYKSLDEHSPTGLSDLFDPVTDSVAPALAPAVQIFSVLQIFSPKKHKTYLGTICRYGHLKLQVTG